ncbi:hypothetical protein AVDCRST_MAG81-4458 [uncultured Synechococcales cyanobacterium]|uniref:Uncharacterized protein n=1 Tax=uncultured Synechococcales cyanobacterium TaxID=1936017 RepID=A0A6J4VY56_9CYAN|nr:hypothetical protein AVDCRST_MAG81-4458 [uncultured Synechococcales cyanobacterium]
MTNLNIAQGWKGNRLLAQIKEKGAKYKAILN